MKSVLLSIQPEWCELIASGKKTIEVRKTRPKIETPFRCYIYCTNTKPYLVWADVFRGNWETEFTHLYGYNRKDAEKIWDVFNGKVIGEFVCNKIDKIDVIDHELMTYIQVSQKADMFITQETCLEVNELQNYLGDKTGYGWHISDLVIYDKPKELSEFRTLKQCNTCKDGYESTACIYDEDCKVPVPLKRPFQSWGYVYEAD